MNNSIPSIQNVGLMVSVSFTNPKMRVSDKQVTRDAEVEHRAHGALHTTRRLYPKHITAPIIAMDSAVRNYLKGVSACQFGNTGAYLIHKNKALEVSSRLKQFRIEREQLITAFAQNWSRVMDEARVEQGDLFDESVYPDIHEVTSGFSMTVSMLPVGQATSGFFEDLEDDIREAVAEQVRESERLVVDQAVRVPLTRIMECILNVHDKLSRDDSRVHDSLMDSLKDLVETLPALNITGNETVAKLYEYCSRNVLRPVDQVRDRESPERTRVVTSTTKLCERMGVDPKTDLTEPASRREAAEQAVDNLMNEMDGLL